MCLFFLCPCAGQKMSENTNGKKILVHKKDSNNREGMLMPSGGSESYVLSRGRAKNKRSV